MTSDRSNPVHGTLNMYARLFDTGFSQETKSKSTVHLLKRFKNAQDQVITEFRDAKTREELFQAEELLKTWLETHSKMWKTAVEHDSINSLQLLRQLLSDIIYLQEGEYAVSYQDTGLEGGGEAKLDLSQRKQRLADKYRQQLSELQFASYAWAFHLFRDDEISRSTLNWILVEPITDDFGSMQDISEVFFRMRNVQRLEASWERWNMNRELNNNFGVATTGPATSTWILSFYCSTLIWLDTNADEPFWKDAQPEDSPAIEYTDHTLQVDPILDAIDGYTEEYPLESFIGGSYDIKSISASLKEYFERVQNAFKEIEREWTRDQPIEEDLVTQYSEKANSRFNDSTLRTALTDLNKISEVSDINEEHTADFVVSLQYPRRYFVETGISTIFTNNFSKLLSKYREYLIDQLHFSTQQISSYNRLPEKLDDIIDRETVELIITGDSEAQNVLRTHKKSNRTSHNRLRSYLEYGGKPVLNDFGGDFCVLVLFKNEFEYKESSTQMPLTIDYTVGENIEDWQNIGSQADITPSDWVKIEHKYEAEIRADGQAGVLLKL